jgi:hypothetical protein
MKGTDLDSNPRILLQNNNVFIFPLQNDEMFLLNFSVIV